MARPKQDDLGGMTGAGVAPVKIKKLDNLGDKFIDLRDSKADLATQITACEKGIIELMKENGLTSYAFSDQIIELKEASTHVKVKTIKVGEGTGGDEEPETE
jgi:hypothetical protein